MKLTRPLALALALALLPCSAALAATATEAASKVDEHLGRIERILGDVDKAKEILTGKPGTGDATRAQETLRRKEAELEKARVDAMAASSGVSRDKVAAMRASGRGWGDIARELGVSPRIVGVGDDGKDWRGPGPGKGKKKGWKHGMPPGQAKKHGYDD